MPTLSAPVESVKPAPVGPGARAQPRSAPGGRGHGVRTANASTSTVVAALPLPVVAGAVTVSVCVPAGSPDRTSTRRRGVVMAARRSTGFGSAVPSSDTVAWPAPGAVVAAHATAVPVNRNVAVALAVDVCSTEPPYAPVTFLRAQPLLYVTAASFSWRRETANEVCVQSPTSPAAVRARTAAS